MRYVAVHLILTELSQCAPQRKPAAPATWSSCPPLPEERPALTKLLLVYRQWFPSWSGPSASTERPLGSPPPQPRPGVALSAAGQKYPAALRSPSSFESLLLRSLHRSVDGCTVRPSELPPSCSNLRSRSSSGFLSSLAQSHGAAGPAGPDR